MAHYIDADRLRVELKKHLKNTRDYMNGVGMKYKGPKYYKAQGKESAYDAILNILDSLQQEQSEVGLEKEIAIWIPNHIKCEKDPDLKNGIIKWAGFVARHFYELGLNARKEDK